jgi:O-antigen/teichoic acid export membrane protein
VRELVGVGGQAPEASGSLLVRNAIWNLLGCGAPLLVAVVVIPILIRSLGTAKYGTLAIAWGVVGYFGFLKIGLDFTLAKLVGERIGQDSQDQIHGLFNTAFVLLILSGMAGGIVLAAISHPLAYSWLHVPRELREEVCIVFRIFAIAMPFVVSDACFIGTLWAYQRYDLANVTSVVTRVFTFAAAAAVIPFSHSLIPIATLWVAVQVLSWLMFLVLCIKVVPGLSLPPRSRKVWLRPLLTFGGWLSIGGLVGPIFLYSDRFLLGAMISLSAVAYFATPLEMVIKLWIIADSLNGALLPAYTASLRTDGKRAAVLMERIGHYLFPLIFAPVLFIVLFSKEILTLWIDTNFAMHSARILAWLAIGVLFSSITRIPWTLLIAAHRPDLLGKLPLFEVPVYLAFLCFAIHYFGLEGAAIVWTSWMAFNCCALHLITWRLLPNTGRATRKNAILLVISLPVLVVAMFLPQLLAIKGLYFVSSCTALLLWMWFCIISTDERASLRFGWLKFFKT